jgi:hypothetical protein
MSFLTGLRPSGRTLLAHTALCGTLLAAVGGPLLVAPATVQAQWSGDWCRDSGDHDHCEVREFTLELRDGLLEVSARPNGGIQVEGWDGSEVRVEARVTTRARNDRGAQDLAREVEVRTETGRISSDGPRTGGRTSWQVSYRILVPRGARLELESTNGGVRVAGVRGSVDARTTNGGIRLEDVEGAIRARSTNGGVQVSYASGRPAVDRVDLQTTNGPITLSLPEGASARVDASTRNGGITTDFPLTVEGRLGRNLSGTLGSGDGPEIRMQTTNGPIRLRRN